jgi:hypothetical protein
MSDDLVADGFKVGNWELIWPALDLLHCQDVYFGSLQKANNSWGSGPDAVYVPGG